MVNKTLQRKLNIETNQLQTELNSCAPEWHFVIIPASYLYWNILFAQGTLRSLYSCIVRGKRKLDVVVQVCFFFVFFFQDFVGIYLYTIATYQVLVIFTSTICSCKGCCAYFGVPSVFSIRYTGDSYSIYTIYITVSITVVTGLSVPRCPYINRAFTISTLL